MRNLKRALSLLLSSTMVLGMVVMGGSAAGYQDVDASNDNQEAIEVLQAVGIMSGVDDAGNFDPDGSITRNEMAVVMAHLLNLDYDYYRGVNTFSDVPDWAAPYVAACVAEGVTAGVGNGLYGGDQKITAAQAGLMVMKALGYFQNQEDFGSDWQVATIRQASYINLFDKVNSDAESALTRGQVAQLVLNGLKAKMVDFTGDKGIQIGDVTVGYRAEYTARTSAANKYNSIDDGTTNIAENDQYFVQLGEELYDGDLTLKGSTDDFARPANTWRYDGKDIGTYAHTPDLTYTKSVKAGDIYKDLGLSKTINVGDVAVYVDGVENDTEGKAYAIRKGDDTNSFGHNGVLTEVYYNDDDNSVIITEINTYVGTVVKTVDATDKRDAYVVINPEAAINKTSTPSGNMEFETNKSFDDEAYVLYTYSEDTNEIKSVEYAKELTGVVTRAENVDTDQADAKALTIDGTRYVDSFKVAGEELGTISVDEEYTVYLDSYGYLIYVERIDEIGDYALLYTTNLGGIFDSHKALLVFADGTTGVVDTDEHYDEDELNVDTNGDGDKSDNASPVIVTYRVDEDGVYTLRAVADKDGNNATKTFEGKTESATVTDDNRFELINDKAGIKVGDATVTANSATTFVVRDPGSRDISNDYDWTAYTGIKNAPSIEVKDQDADNKINSDEMVTAYYYCKSGSMATIMFIVPDTDVVINDGVNKSIFLSGESVSNLIHDKDGDYYEYDAIVNGEIKTVKVDESLGKNLDGMFKSYSVDKYGIITKLYDYDPYAEGDGEGLATATGIDKVSKEYTVILAPGTDDEKTITVDEDANFYYVDEDGKISNSSYNAIAIDDNDKVFAIVDDYMVQTLVIVEVGTSASEYAATVKVDGSADDHSKVTVSGNLTEIVRGDDLVFTVEPKNGITVKSVKVDGRTVTADKNGEYVVNNITKAPTIEITTEGTAIVDANVKLSIAGDVLVTMDGVNYISSQDLKLVSGKTYVIQAAAADGTTLKVTYDGKELPAFGTDKDTFTFVAKDNAVLSATNVDASKLTLGAPVWSAETSNKDNVNKMMAALWTPDSHHEEQGITFDGAMFKWDSNKLTINVSGSYATALEAVKTWAQGNYASHSIPVAVTLPAGVTADNTDANWSNSCVIWVDLDNTENGTISVSVNGGTLIEIPVEFTK